MKEKKRKIFTGFIIFLGIMWLCTLISRAVYAYQLPMVTVQKPDSKYVEHKVEAEGIVVAGELCQWSSAFRDLCTGR